VCVRHHRSAARTGLVDANGWRTSPRWVVIVGKRPARWRMIV
jgi:hypothetical protein